MDYADQKVGRMISWANDGTIAYEEIGWKPRAFQHQEGQNRTFLVTTATTAVGVSLASCHVVRPTTFR